MSIVSTITDALGRAAMHALRQVIGPAIGACVVGYFAYYAVYGDRGLMAMKHLEGEIARAEATLADVRGERERMELRVMRLRSDHLDLDMLDERARTMLNLGDERDVVIALPTAPPDDRSAEKRPESAR